MCLHYASSHASSFRIYPQRDMLRRTRLNAQGRAAARQPLTFQVGNVCNGFQLAAVRSFDELNLKAFEFVHVKTQAKLFHFDTPDTNNTFCIGFATPAQNSKGTTHVLEHTVLCGSKHYPVRDPFFHMLRRSLSTFMNAMTGADYTMYPFATTNVQDYANLLNVYTDAVFFPLLRPEDFRQEGHRLEINDSGDRVVQNGVVYNEMRGVVSEPGTFFSHKLMESMLPGTHYEHISGGYPPEILNLTHEELTTFHREHYHPSNSISITYGDMDPTTHMKKLNDVFSSFSLSERVKIPFLQTRRTEETTVSAEGPLDPMGNPQEQNRVAVSFAVPAENSSLDDMVRMVVLDSLLTSGPSSPLYQALLESKLGSRYCPMSGFAYYLSSPILTYGVEGVSSSLEKKEEVVKTAVLNALTNVSKNGFDKRRVESVIFAEEMQQKHRSASYGISLCTSLCALGLVRPNINPCDFVNWLPHLKKIGESYEKELLPLVETAFLKNQHRSVLSVTPKPSFLDDFQKVLDAKEEAVNVTLTDDAKKEIAKETELHRARLREQLSSECLPTLTVNDIPREPFIEPQPVPSAVRPHQVFTIPHPTNGLVYVHGLIPFPDSILNEIRSGSAPVRLPLYHSLLGQTGAGAMDYKELSVEVELVCGGFNFSPTLTSRATGRSDFTAATSFGFYTTKEKLNAALNLLGTILRTPRRDIGDDSVRSRILTHTIASCSRKIQSIQRQGNTYASLGAASKLTAHGAVKEAWSGLSSCTASSKLLESLRGSATVDAALNEVISCYGGTTDVLSSNVASGLLWATCEANVQDEVASALNQFMSSFEHHAQETTAPLSVITQLPVSQWGSVPVASWEDCPCEEHPLPIDTSFVGLAIPNNLTTISKEQQALRVSAQLLKNEYLHRVIREEGGAYGSAATSNLNGEVGGVAMSSYRDPTPKKTMESLSKASAVIADASYVTQQRIDEAKLRLFSMIDTPQSADTFGESYFYHGTTNEMLREVRHHLLSVSPADVVNAAKYFALTTESRYAVLQPQPQQPEKASPPPTE